MFYNNLFDKCLEQIIYEGFSSKSKEKKLERAPEPPEGEITDEHVEEDLFKVCKQMAAKARSLMNGKYTMLKKGSNIFIDDKYYSGERYLSFIHFNLWDVTENPREDFRDTPAGRSYFKNLDNLVRELRQEAPKGYSVDINGDWDTFEMQLITYK